MSNVRLSDNDSGVLIVIPEAEEDLKQSFEQFTENPMHRFIVNVRRKRALQLKKLLSSPQTLSTATFEREVWHLESQTYWHGYEIELQYHPYPLEFLFIKEICVYLNSEYT